MNVNDLRIRDPFIIKENNKYYLTGTTDEMKIYGFISDDLFTFSDPILLFDPVENDIDTECAWAPEIHKYNNEYYLIFTLRIKGHKRGSYIAKSNSIFGKYKLISNNPITPSNWECLDASLFVDNGVPYIVFCHEWLEVRNGEILIAKASDDLTKLISEPVLLFKANEAKWVSPISNDGYVTDGPFIYKDNGKYKMLWSSFYLNKYALSIITSDNLLSNWKQEDVPFIKEDAGHGMLFIDNDTKYIVLHGPNEYLKERLRLIKLN